MRNIMFSVVVPETSPRPTLVKIKKALLGYEIFGSKIGRGQIDVDKYLHIHAPSLIKVHINGELNTDGEWNALSADLTTKLNTIFPGVKIHFA